MKSKKQEAPVKNRRLDGYANSAIYPVLVKTGYHFACIITMPRHQCSGPV